MQSIASQPFPGLICVGVGSQLFHHLMLRAIPDLGRRPSGREFGRTAGITRTDIRVAARGGTEPRRASVTD
ncbi:MAG: hypothetical protein QNJ20_17310 [Paracoccaceae bacterium]|nr:hypothetical protein [Paracoccaceae bacterium]